ncbi:hypothetical protein ACHAWO_013488 [Cyclotella atomus]|uniref:Uncharacterized protein n=1 Tax=Cyclotella atomus TaxID=382360 RepID=A0ABD3Q0D9_9STRA
MKLVQIACLSVGMIMCTSVRAFSPSLQSRICNKAVELHATSAETEAERLRAKARELMAQVKQQEDDLHNNIMAKKRSRDAHIDQIISELFPTNNEGDTGDLVSRLRNKRLAAEVLVQIVERLHQRTRVADKKEPELASCTDQLIEAAAILDQEFVNQKTRCGDKITHADLVHWGGGNVSGILKDKDKDLAREYDEQFQKRLESFYDAAVKKHTRDEVDSRGWMDGDAWKP